VRTGRRAAIVTAGLALATALTAGIAGRRSILERWWIWRLGSGDRSVRDAAAGRLGELRSLRAIEPLIDAWRTRGDPVEDYSRYADHLHPCESALLQIGEPAFPALREALLDPSRSVHAAEVIVGIGGGEAVVVLMEGLRSGDAEIRGNAALFIRSLGRDAQEAVPTLERLLGDSDDRVREMAGRALDEIQERSPKPNRDS
jgi:HEAT repeat protein